MVAELFGRKAFESWLHKAAGSSDHSQTARQAMPTLAYLELARMTRSARMVLA